MKWGGRDLNAKDGAGVFYLDKGGARDFWEAGHTLNVTNASLSAGVGFVVVIADNMMLSSSYDSFPPRSVSIHSTAPPNWPTSREQRSLHSASSVFHVVVAPLSLRPPKLL